MVWALKPPKDDEVVKRAQAYNSGLLGLSGVYHRGALVALIRT